MFTYILFFISIQAKTGPTNRKKSPNEFGLKAAIKKQKVLGQSPKGFKGPKPKGPQSPRGPKPKGPKAQSPRGPKTQKQQKRPISNNSKIQSKITSTT